MEQETFIYIDDKQKYDASVAANTFTNDSVKNRVYINTLGAELGMKYLNSENIDTSVLKNLHSIKKVIEEFDVADIMLKGIHIDVRVVFDEDVIFVPKSHFEYNIIPDIYLVFKIEKEHSRVKFLGFFEPKLINKNNANKDYYFIEKEKLSSVFDLPQYIETHNSGNDVNLSADDIENAENLIIAMSDNDISESDKKHLLEQLTKSAELRDKFIEYENFETLSYKAMTDPSIDKHDVAQDVTPVDEFDMFEDALTTDTTETAVETLDENAENIINSDADIESDAIIEDIDNIADDIESNADAEQEFPAEETEVSDLFLEDNAKLQNEDSDILQESENSDGLDLDDAIGALGAAAGTVGIAAAAAPAAAGIESVIDSTSTNAQELIENASDLAENLVDTASNDAENIINDTIQEDNSNLTDAISIDSVKVDDKVEEISETNFEKVDLPEDHEVKNDNFDISEIHSNILEEAVSLEAVVPEDMLIEDDKMSEGTISLESIDVPDLPDEEEDYQLDLDDENSYLDNFSEEQPDANMEDSISLEDIDDSHIGGADTLTAFGSIDDEDTDDLIIDYDESSTETFGKNLMENLAESDDVLIDGLDIEQQGADVEQPAEEDLLAQVNDVIDTASLSNVPVESDNSGEDVGLDLLDTAIDENNLTDEEVLKSDDNNIKTEDTLLDDLLLETSEQADELLLEPVENAEIMDTSEVETPLIQEDAADLADASIELSQPSEMLETSELQDTILQEAQTEYAIDELVKQEQEQEISDEFDNTATDVPQDYIENLLNQENAESTDFAETNENDLNVLYTESETTATETIQPAFDDINELEEIETDENTNIPGAALINQKQQQNNSSKIFILAAVMVGLIAAATVFYFVKPKDNNSADFEPLPNNSKTALVDNSAKSTDTPAGAAKKSSRSKKSKSEVENKTTENVLKTNAPEVKKNEKNATQSKKQVVKELKNVQQQKPIASTAYMSVSKLVWDVPDNLSYSARMQNYLRTTGKSIKLTLSTDLLLATEYAYANSVKVGITIGKDGSVQSTKILASSGSGQIDNIVLQSVKETLNAIKPPSEDVKGKEFNLNLIIYF